MSAVYHTRRRKPGFFISTLLIVFALSFTPAQATSVKLAWNPVAETGLLGYRIHLGTVSQVYTVTHETLETTSEVPDLLYDTTYYLAVSVIGGNGLESPLSEEISVTLASPQEILVNGSFETGTYGWTTTGNQSVQSTEPYQPTDGTRIVALNAGDLAPNAVLSQTFPTAPGETYVLSFDAGVLSFNRNVQTLTVNVSGSASLVSQSLTLQGDGSGGNLWQPQTFSFVADSSTTTLVFSDLSPTSNSIDLLLDKVRVMGPAALPVVPPVPPVIGNPSLTGQPGSMSISLQVASAGTYVLQRSVDLVRWEQIAETELLESGIVEFLDESPQELLPAVFYRIGSTAFASGNP